jgi:hypothetical protein
MYPPGIQQYNLTVGNVELLRLTLGSRSLYDAGRPLGRRTRLQICRMLKSVVVSFRPDSVLLTAVRILRDLGVTSLIIIGDLRPVNCAAVETGAVTYEVSVTSCLVLFCECIFGVLFCFFNLRNCSVLGYKIVLDYIRAN